MIGPLFLDRFRAQAGFIFVFSHTKAAHVCSSRSTRVFPCQMSDCAACVSLRFLEDSGRSVYRRSTTRSRRPSRTSWTRPEWTSEVLTLWNSPSIEDSKLCTWNSTSRFLALSPFRLKNRHVTWVCVGRLWAVWTRSLRSLQQRRRGSGECMFTGFRNPHLERTWGGGLGVWNETNRHPS